MWMPSSRAPHQPFGACGALVTSGNQETVDHGRSVNSIAFERCVVFGAGGSRNQPWAW